jgi:hypothetical protein
VTHTSDSFDICEKYAVKMIEEGKAYMDDTDQEKMQAERMARQESYRRNTLPAENLIVSLSLSTSLPSLLFLTSLSALPRPLERRRESQEVLFASQD